MVLPSHCARISSSIENGQELCPGNEITLTCETSRSYYQTWMNSEYIGEQDLMFTVFDDLGTTHHSTEHSTTVAELTYVNPLKYIYAMKSDLRITVGADIASTSVSCVGDNETMDSFSLRSLGK